MLQAVENRSAEFISWCELVRAKDNNNIDVIKANFKNEYFGSSFQGTPILLLAIVYFRTDVVAWLLRQDMSLLNSVTEKDGFTAFHLACRTDHPIYSINVLKLNPAFFNSVASNTSLNGIGVAFECNKIRNMELLNWYDLELDLETFLQKSEVSEKLTDRAALQLYQAQHPELKADINLMFQLNRGLSEKHLDTLHLYRDFQDQLYNYVKSYTILYSCTSNSRFSFLHEDIWVAIAESNITSRTILKTIKEDNLASRAIAKAKAENRQIDNVQQKSSEQQVEDSFILERKNANLIRTACKFAQEYPSLRNKEFSDSFVFINSVKEVEYRLRRGVNYHLVDVAIDIARPVIESFNKVEGSNSQTEVGFLMRCVKQIDNYVRVWQHQYMSSSLDSLSHTIFKALDKNRDKFERYISTETRKEISKFVQGLYKGDIWLNPLYSVETTVTSFIDRLADESARSLNLHFIS